jgi:hypothetical protein
MKNIYKNIKKKKAVHKKKKKKKKSPVQPEHPLQPQCMHSTIRPSSSLPFGTLQIQFVPKFVSLVWIQRKQHRFS